jgi:phospholipase/lecithinase/hemolysin
MKRSTLLALAFIAAITSFGQPTFTSLRVFGDSASSTTNGPANAFYYNRRYSNGRMWVEVLASWRAMPFNITNDNNSYWEHYSPILVNDVNAYTPPPDVSTALYVVWVANADMYKNFTTTPGLVYDNSNLSFWNNNNNAWVSNHFKIITNLYGKGVRTLLMPNAVDLTKTPRFAPGLSAPERAWIRLRTTEFNTAFKAMLTNTAATYSNLTIYSPDIFKLFDSVLAQPSSYGMTNPGVGATDDYELGGLTDISLNGPGANYVYWDFIHPTAKFQMLFAQEAHELIWPARIGAITSSNGTNQLTAVNLAIERNGVVQASTNLTVWTNAQSFPSTNATQVIPVPASGPRQFYRLQFPFNWVWP